MKDIYMNTYLGEERKKLYGVAIDTLSIRLGKKISRSKYICEKVDELIKEMGLTKGEK